MKKLMNFVTAMEKRPGWFQCYLLKFNNKKLPPMACMLLRIKINNHYFSHKCLQWDSDASCIITYHFSFPA